MDGAAFAYRCFYAIRAGLTDATGRPTNAVYGFARIPDIALYFRLDLDIALGRILEGRPELKYFEAGMDMHLSSDPYESFRIFQGRILEQYLAMSTEFNFSVIDANQPVEAQQSIIRELVAARIDLAAFAANRPDTTR